METVFSNNTDANNKIKEMEAKIAELMCELEEKQETIDAIEKNMESFYVENWKITDSNGKKGSFSGNIYWIKGSGLMYYKNGTYFEGEWNSVGEISYGELKRTYTDDIITKWMDGEEVDDEDEHKT